MNESEAPTKGAVTHPCSLAKAVTSLVYISVYPCDEAKVKRLKEKALREFRVSEKSPDFPVLFLLWMISYLGSSWLLYALAHPSMGNWAWLLAAIPSLCGLCALAFPWPSFFQRHLFLCTGKWLPNLAETYCCPRVKKCKTFEVDSTVPVSDPKFRKIIPFLKEKCRPVQIEFAIEKILGEKDAVILEFLIARHEWGGKEYYFHSSNDLE